MISGGAPLNPEIGGFFLALGVRLLQGYVVLYPNELYLASWRQDCGYHGARVYRTMGVGIAWRRSASGRLGSKRAGALRR